MVSPHDDLQELDELEEDDASKQDEPDAEAIREHRRIFTDKSDPPVSSLYTNWKAGDLVLTPIFQRRKVWDDARSSRLVESVILEVPLPVFYFAESQDGIQEVIDGQSVETLNRVRRACLRPLAGKKSTAVAKPLDLFSSSVKGATSTAGG